MKLTSLVFNSSSSWTAPAGVTRVILIGYGGGSGGKGGRSSTGAGAFEGAAGGLGCAQQPLFVTVVPNTSYTITIGTGGTAGVGGSGVTDATNTAGGDTTFGALATFKGAMSGTTTRQSSANYGVFDLPEPYSGGGNTPMRLQSGGESVNTNNGSDGFIGSVGLFALRGNATRTSTTGGNGGGGCSGGGGIGGTGGNGGATGVAGSAGASAAANTGAGGGGGGGAGSGTASGGNGGAGGSGRLTIVWVE
jgi:hypothetical protein